MVSAPILGSEEESALDPKDFEFTSRDFEFLRKLASDHSGIVLPDNKQRMVYSRLAKRLRVLGLTRFSEYRALLESGDSDEFGEFINALTTNLTYFFRESHHFDHLRDVALPEVLQSKRPGRRVRIWSAGCSTGEEPHTISIVTRAALSRVPGAWDYRILATDLDTKVLATAAAGVYEEKCIAGLDDSVLKGSFLRGKGSTAGKVRIKPEIQTPISFRQLNLVQDWRTQGFSIKEPFDIIFCRNVVIYFDRPTQKILFDRFADVLAPGGHLYIGHSETLFQSTDRFSLVGKTTYRRTG